MPSFRLLAVTFRKSAGVREPKCPQNDPKKSLSDPKLLPDPEVCPSKLYRAVGGTAVLAVVGSGVLYGVVACTRCAFIFDKQLAR